MKQLFVSFLLLSLMLLSNGINAQTLLRSTHTPRHGDTMKRTQLLSLSTVNSDNNSVWDLTQLENNGKTMRQRYRQPSDTIPIIGAVEYGTRYYYPTDTDTMRLLKLENNLMFLGYDLPETRMRFPVNLGDSIGGLFHATGTYCDKLRFRSFGQYHVVADAEGKIVCHNGDTLRHVLRLHTVRITAQQHFPIDTIPSGIDVFTTDSILFHLQTDSIQLREDIFRWYALGYRYPILEVFAESYDPVQPCNQLITWYCPPEEQKLLDLDEENLNNRQEQDRYARTEPAPGSPLADNQGKGYSTITYTVEKQPGSKTLHIE